MHALIDDLLTFTCYYERNDHSIRLIYRMVFDSALENLEVPIKESEAIYHS